MHVGTIHRKILAECSAMARDPLISKYPDFAVNELLQEGYLRVAPWHTFMVETTSEGRAELESIREREVSARRDE